jgi:transglutaminase-like putative cysteine protease
VRRRSRGIALALAFVAVSIPSAIFGGEQTAAYRASGAQAGLFDQYDIDGYSLAASAAPDGSVELKVRVVDFALRSSAPFRNRALPGAALVPAPDRDAFARERTKGSPTQAEAVRRLLAAIAGEVRYDPDRDRNQDPAAVFASRRAYCVGYAELAVDLLRRVGISARTVQGILRTDASADRYDPEIGGVYHRWIEIFYADRGYVFSDPAASINGVDARYVPFDRRALTRPQSLRVIEQTPLSGVLRYDTLRSGGATLRVRRVR